MEKKTDRYGVTGTTFSIPHSVKLFYQLQAQTHSQQMPCKCFMRAGIVSSALPSSDNQLGLQIPMMTWAMRSWWPQWYLEQGVATKECLTEAEDLSCSTDNRAILFHCCLCVIYRSDKSSRMPCTILLAHNSVVFLVWFSTLVQNKYIFFYTLDI